ncbi:hypothetical protein HDK90DRAFT_535210, partial [Phyllosticta capitalensis]
AARLQRSRGNLERLRVLLAKLQSGSVQGQASTSKRRQKTRTTVICPPVPYVANTVCIISCVGGFCNAFTDAGTKVWRKGEGWGFIPAR